MWSHGSVLFRPGGSLLGLRVLAAGMGVVALALTCVGGAPPADAATGGPPSLVINLNTTHNPGYNLGRQKSYYSPNSLLAIPWANESGIAVTADAGRVDDFRFEFAPPTGQKLHAGIYSPVAFSGELGPGYAKAEVSSGTGTENWDSGEVEIRDLAIDTSGNVSRIDLLFRFGAAYPADALFGEIRFGEPETSGRTLSAHTIKWPMSPIGAPPVLATEWVHNTGSLPLTVGATRVTGASSADFKLKTDSCTGRTIAPGQTCAVVVGFTPTRAGQRAAVLNVPINGATDAIALRGAAPPGFTELVTSGDDFLDHGARHDFVDGPYQLAVRGGRYGLDFRPTKVYDYPFFNTGTVASFSSASGQPLTVGKHKADANPSATAYGINIGGCGYSTGTVDIKQLKFAADGTLLVADIAFTQICAEDPTHPMTGHVKWRVPTATVLNAGATLGTDQSLLNNVRRLVAQSDGNLVVYNSAGRALWNSHTAGPLSRNRLVLQTDGNLVLYTPAGRAVWNTHTAGTGTQNRLVLQGDGNLVLYTSAGRAIWNSHTQG